MALAGRARAGGVPLWSQKVVRLPAKPRGCHVVTRELVKELQQELEQYQVGLANFFIMHTSASLTINENASPDVPLDLNDALDRIAPEGNHYRHSDEGPDDMPAHVKSSLMGQSLTVPVGNGRLVRPPASAAADAAAAPPESIPVPHPHPPSSAPRRARPAWRQTNTVLLSLLSRCWEPGRGSTSTSTGTTGAPARSWSPSRGRAGPKPDARVMCACFIWIHVENINHI